MKTVGVIPARYASSRFEGKPLVDIRGKPMIQHVYERASRAKRLDEIVVATDDSRIHDAVRGFGGKVAMTPEFPTGTDRVAYVAEHVRCDVVANIQGDEPLLEPMMLDQMIQPFHDDPEVQVSTLKQRVENEADYRDVNVGEGCLRSGRIRPVLLQSVHPRKPLERLDRNQSNLPTHWAICLSERVPARFHEVGARAV